MPTSPPVSVVIAVYNGADTLQRCLDSVATQTYPNFEIIFVDDGSTDETHKKLITWQESHPDIAITILKNENNLGLTASLNRGIAAAKGEYIARIDADDWWHPEKLKKQMAFFADHPDHGIVGSWYNNVRNSHATTVHLPLHDDDIRRSIFWRNPFGHSCIVIRKKILDHMDAYDEKLRFGQDRDLWFRLLPLTKLANIPEVLCHRTVNSTSTTNVRAQIKQQIKTVHTYARLYHASPVVYLSLIEPLVLYLIPTSLRFSLRTLYDRLFTH